MTLSPELRTRLLEAIETNSLVFLCGAGLSMAAPSDLPSAKRIANLCYDRRLPIEALDIAVRDDIDQLAGIFHGRGDFERVFIHLVPWAELRGAPNAGHAAISDLLITKGAHAALSANFDRMIEAWAQNLKVDMRGALTGPEAEDFTAISSPLLKFHGCIELGRNETLWTREQLRDPSIEARLTSCSQWMNMHLPGKHLVVVGFWSDWGYLNQVFTDAFTVNNASAVTVIDPSPTAQLQTKARELWARLNALSHRFEHIRESGAAVLEELRLAYSRAWVRRFYSTGENMLNAWAATTARAPRAIAAVAGAPAVGPDTLDMDALYDLRRDAEGVPYSRAAKLKEPPDHSAQASFLRLALLSDGAIPYNSWLDHDGRRIRIINGGGRSLESVQGAYVEPPASPQPDLVVCAGAFRTGVPARIIPRGVGLSIVRPAPGSSAPWLTLDEARIELNL